MFLTLPVVERSKLFRFGRHTADSKSRIPRCWVLVVTTRHRIGLGHNLWGGLPYPELSDWHPKGAVCQAYGLFNEERGTPIRAVVIIDKTGKIRFRQTYEPGTLPDPDAIMQVLEGIG